MAIEFVGGNIASKLGATSGNSTIALNSGLTGGIASSVSEGDLVIAGFSTASVADRTLAVTDGSTNYTVIGSELYANGSSYDTNLRVAYKFMGATPDTSTTFGPTGNAADGGAMFVYVFRGVDQTTPLDVAVQTANGTTTHADPPSITPSTSGAFIVVISASGSTGGESNFDTPSDLVDFRSASISDTYDPQIGVGHKDDWTSGAFDPEAWGGSSGNPGATWLAMTIALRPAATNKEITADGGSYALTGSTASLKFGREVSATAGSYTITGTSATLKIGRKLSAEAGSFAISGSTASLLRGYKNISDAGSFTLTGSTAQLLRGFKVSAEAGSYIITGSDATLIYTPITGYTISADGGVYFLTGTSASLEFGRKISAEAGSYSLTGSPASLIKALSVSAETGVYGLTGNTASLLRAFYATGDSGSYTLTGTSAALERGFLTNAEAGTYTLTGSVATLLKGYTVSGDVGNYAITGQEATLIYDTGDGVIPSDYIVSPRRRRRMKKNV